MWFSSTRQGFESPIWNIVCFFLLVECVGLCDELFFGFLAEAQETEGGGIRVSAGRWLGNLTG